LDFYSLFPAPFPPLILVFLLPTGFLGICITLLVFYLSKNPQYFTSGIAPVIFMACISRKVPMGTTKFLPPPTMTEYSCNTNLHGRTMVRFMTDRGQGTPDNRISSCQNNFIRWRITASSCFIIIEYPLFFSLSFGEYAKGSFPGPKNLPSLFALFTTFSSTFTAWLDAGGSP